MMYVVVKTRAIRRANLQSNRHHQQTNTKLFTSRMPFLSPNQQCPSTEGKISHSNQVIKFYVNTFLSLLIVSVSR